MRDILWPGVRYVFVVLWYIRTLPPIVAVLVDLIAVSSTRNFLEQQWVLPVIIPLLFRLSHEGKRMKASANVHAEGRHVCMCQGGDRPPLPILRRPKTPSDTAANPAARRPYPHTARPRTRGMLRLDHWLAPQLFQQGYQLRSSLFMGLMIEEIVGQRLVLVWSRVTTCSATIRQLVLDCRASSWGSILPMGHRPCRETRPHRARKASGAR